MTISYFELIKVTQILSCNDLTCVIFNISTLIKLLIEKGTGEKNNKNKIKATKLLQNILIRGYLSGNFVFSNFT